MTSEYDKAQPVAPTNKGRAYIEWQRHMQWDTADMMTAFGAGYDAGSELVKLADAAANEAMRGLVPSEYLDLAEVAIENAPHEESCQINWMGSTAVTRYECTCWKAKYDEARREMRA
jgi:hypothetical protein